MTQEEKAKAYDEAIKEASIAYKDEDRHLKATLERIFPELAESEDEKIREYLIRYIDNTMKSSELKSKILARLENIPYTIDREKREGFHLGYKAALEKQGESYTKRDVDDAYVEGMAFAKYELEKQAEQKLYVNDNAKEMFIKALERVEEQNAKGYKLTDCDKNSWWEDFKEYTTSEQILANSAKTCKDEQKSAWSEEDSARLQRIIDFLWYNRKGDTDTIYQQEQDIDWLKSLKDRIQPKQEWSEEDEHRINLLEALCEDKLFESVPNSTMYREMRLTINWLNSLSPRKRWKPSDEQMHALHDLNLTGNISYAGQGQTLIELYNDLEKLTEE